MTLEQVNVDPSTVAETEAVQVTERLSPEEVFEQQMQRTEEVFEPAEQTPVSQEPVVEPIPEPVVESASAPVHWPQERQDMFNNLPLEAKDDYLNVAKDQERSYNEKKMQLAEYRREVAEAVAQLAQPQKETKPQSSEPPPPPDDPIDRIKWEAKAEILEELKARDVRSAELERTRVIEDVRKSVATDPIRAEAQQVLNAVVMGQPDIVCHTDPQGRTYRKIEYDRLNLEPEYFKTKYVEARELVLKNKEQPVTPNRVAKTPVLEVAGQSGGVVLPTEAEATRKSILTGIRKGKIDSHTLGNYLQATVQRAL